MSRFVDERTNGEELYPEDQFPRLGKEGGF